MMPVRTDGGIYDRESGKNCMFPGGHKEDDAFNVAHHVHFFKRDSGKKAKKPPGCGFFSAVGASETASHADAATFLKTLRKKPCFPVDNCPFHGYIIRIRFFEKQTRFSCSSLFPCPVGRPVPEPECTAWSLADLKDPGGRAPENTGNDDERDRF